MLSATRNRSIDSLLSLTSAVSFPHRLFSPARRVTHIGRWESACKCQLSWFFVGEVVCHGPGPARLWQALQLDVSRQSRLREGRESAPWAI